MGFPAGYPTTKRYDPTTGGWRGQLLALGLLILGIGAIPVLAFVGLVAVLYASGAFGYSPPAFVRDAEPKEAHRVLVNRCCGGSADDSEPYQVFYGTSLTFEEVTAHYVAEMAKRGFRANGTRFEKAGWCHDFWIEPFSSGKRYELLPEDEAKLAKLGDYQFAYVATYLELCP